MKTKEEIAILHTYENQDWVFIVLVLIVGLVGAVRAMFPSQFRLMWRMLSLKNYAENFFALDAKKSNTFSLILQSVALLTGGLLIHLLLPNEVLNEVHPVNRYILIVLGLSFFSILKSGIGMAIGWLIEMPHIIERYQLLKKLHYHLISVLIIPPVALGAYAVPNREFWLVASAAIASILLVSGTLRSAWQMNSELKLYYVYVFLYFCALEIAPIALIASTVLNSQ